jgi:hypothetical protein
MTHTQWRQPRQRRQSTGPPRASLRLPTCSSTGPALTCQRTGLPWTSNHRQSPPWCFIATPLGHDCPRTPVLSLPQATDPRAVSVGTICLNRTWKSTPPPYDPAPARPHCRTRNNAIARGGSQIPGRRRSTLLRPLLLPKFGHCPSSPIRCTSAKALRMSSWLFIRSLRCRLLPAVHGDPATSLGWLLVAGLPLRRSPPATSNNRGARPSGTEGPAPNQPHTITRPPRREWRHPVSHDLGVAASEYTLKPWMRHHLRTDGAASDLKQS